MNIPKASITKSTRTTPKHLKPFDDGVLCFVVYRSYKGKGPKKLILHAAEALGRHKYGYGAMGFWVTNPPHRI